MQDTSKVWLDSENPQVHPVFLKCASKIVATLDQRTHNVISGTQNLMFDLAQEAASNVEQTRFFEGMQALQRQGEQLQQSFINAIGKKLRDFCHHPNDVWLEHKDPAESGASLPNELRVLDDRDLAETLAIDSMIDTAEIRYARHLYALNIRLSESVGAEKILTNRVNPIGPKQICETFRDILADFDSELEVHISLYKEFDKELIRRLGDVYQKANQMLAEAGIQPEIKFEHVKHKKRQKSQESQADEPEAFEEAVEEIEPNITLDTPDGFAQENQIERLESQLYSSIHELLAQKRAQQAPVAHTAPAGPVVNRQSLVDALTSLQQQLLQPQQHFAPTSDVKDQLIQQLQQSMQLDQPAQIRSLDENTIDAVGMMFDFISSDQQLPGEFQLALSKLQIPYLKASIHNPKLFTSPRGPARKLLNEIANAGNGWNKESDKGQALLQKVNEVIDRALNEYQDDDSIFTSLLEDFQNFRKREQRRSAIREKRERETVQGAERLQMARNDVGRVIMEQIQGHEIPSLVKDLLQKPWAHVMVLTLLQHGRESQQWKSALSTAQELVWSVSFEKSNKNVTRLRTRLPVLAKTLSTGLKQVGYQDSEIRKILFNLKQIYVSLVKQTGDDRIVIEASEEGLVIRGEDITDHAELEQTPSADNEEDLRELLDNIQAWKEGQWVMFHRDAQEPMRAKLSWISPITGRYLFVDQRGMKAQEKTIQELAEDLLGDRVSLMDREELVNRALTAVRDSLAAELES